MLDSCRGVTLHGAATLTYPKSQFPYAQGTVLAASADSMNFQVQVHPIYDPTVLFQKSSAPALCGNWNEHGQLPLVRWRWWGSFAGLLGRYMRTSWQLSSALWRTTTRTRAAAWCTPQRAKSLRRGLEARVGILQPTNKLIVTNDQARMSFLQAQSRLLMMLDVCVGCRLCHPAGHRPAGHRQYLRIHT